MSIGHAIALAAIIGLLVTCAHFLRDIHSEVRMLTCITLAENGIRCPALKEKIADVHKDAELREWVRARGEVK